ncbi:MAG: ATP-binding protein, partial [Streptococcus parasanguinis]|nr:ATP-binding protein [Streptococcus parasanguinis]
NKAYGIIDYDWMDEEKIAKYKKKNIFVLPFNEIEMLLVDEAVVKSVLASDDQDKELKLNKFQEAIKSLCIENKDKIVSIALKKKLDEFMESHFIEENKPTKRGAQEFLESLVTRFNVTSTVENITSIVDKSIVSPNFASILKVCNLKNEIINKLGDNLITRDFKNKSINRITINPELQNLLRNKYFGELVTLLNNN